MSDDAIARARARFQAEAERIRHQVQDAEAEAERVERQTRTEPASGPDEAARQLADIRDRLDRDLTTLEARLPPQDVLLAQARTVGGAAAAGVAGLTVLGVVLRRRRDQRAHERDLRTQAAEIARFLPGAVDPDAADDDGGSDAAGGGGLRRWLGVLALLLAGAAAGYGLYQRLRDGGDGPAGG